MKYVQPSIKEVSVKGAADCACGLLVGNGNG